MTNENKRFTEPYTLVIDDPELLVYLAHVPDNQQQRFLLTALRIGLLTLHSAKGDVDRQTLLDMTEQLKGRLQDSLEAHQLRLTDYLDHWVGEKGRFDYCFQKNVQSLLKQLDPKAEDSPLNATLAAVEKAVSDINSQWQGDKPESAMARLQQLIVASLDSHYEKIQQWQHGLEKSLLVEDTRKQESMQGARHGEVFESALNDTLNALCQQIGHVVEPTGSQAGLIKNCKVGDAVIHIGEDHIAAGSRIVIEAKESKSYTLKAALEEMKTACKNREADVGIFVFSEKRKPKTLKPFQRFGDHLIVVWDSENTASDIYLEAAIMVATALCKEKQYQAPEMPDFSAMKQAVVDLEKELEGLDELKKQTATISNASEKMQKRLGLIQDVAKTKIADLNRGVELLYQIGKGEGLV